MRLTVDTTDPAISFDDTVTPADDSTSGSTVEINVTSSDASNNYSGFIDWNRSLVGWWRLEQGNGTWFADSSSYGNNGTCDLASGYCPNLTTGYRGKALEFDGSNDYIQIPNDISYKPASELTISSVTMPFLSTRVFKPSSFARFLP